MDEGGALPSVGPRTRDGQEATTTRQQPNLSDSLASKLPVGSRFAVSAVGSGDARPEASQGIPGPAADGEEGLGFRDAVTEGAAPSAQNSDPQMASLHVKFSASTRFNASDANSGFVRPAMLTRALPERSRLSGAGTPPPVPPAHSWRQTNKDRQRRLESRTPSNSMMGNQHGATGSFLQALSGRGHRRSTSADSFSVRRSGSGGGAGLARSRSASRRFAPAGESLSSGSASGQPSPGRHNASRWSRSSRGSPGARDARSSHAQGGRGRSHTRSQDERGHSGSRGGRQASRSGSDSDGGLGRRRRAGMSSREGGLKGALTALMEGGGSTRHRRSVQQTSVAGDDGVPSRRRLASLRRETARTSHSLGRSWSASHGRPASSQAGEGGSHARAEPPSPWSSHALLGLAMGRRRSSATGRGARSPSQHGSTRSQERYSPTERHESASRSTAIRAVPTERAPPIQRPILNQRLSPGNAIATASHGRASLAQWHGSIAESPQPSYPLRRVPSAAERNPSLDLRLRSENSSPQSTPTLAQQASPFEQQRPPELQMQQFVPRPLPFVARQSLFGSSSPMGAAGVPSISLGGTASSLPSPAFAVSPRLPSGPHAQPPLAPPQSQYTAPAAPMWRQRSESRTPPRSDSRPRRAESGGRVRAVQRRADAAEARAGRRSRSARRHDEADHGAPRSYASRRRQSRASASPSPSRASFSREPSAVSSNPPAAEVKKRKSFLDWLSGLRVRGASTAAPPPDRTNTPPVPVESAVAPRSQSGTSAHAPAPNAPAPQTQATTDIPQSAAISSGGLRPDRLQPPFSASPLPQPEVSSVSRAASSSPSPPRYAPQELPRAVSIPIRPGLQAALTQSPILPQFTAQRTGESPPSTSPPVAPQLPSPPTHGSPPSAPDSPHPIPVGGFMMRFAAQLNDRAAKAGDGTGAPAPRDQAAAAGTQGPAYPRLAAKARPAPIAIPDSTRAASTPKPGPKRTPEGDGGVSSSPEKAGKGAWGKLGRALGAIVPKRWRSPVKASPAKSASLAVAAPPAVSSPSASEQVTQADGGFRVSDSLLPSPAFPIPRIPTSMAPASRLTHSPSRVRITLPTRFRPGVDAPQSSGNSSTGVQEGPAQGRSGNQEAGVAVPTTAPGEMGKDAPGNVALGTVQPLPSEAAAGPTQGFGRATPEVVTKVKRKRNGRTRSDLPNMGSDAQRLASPGSGRPGSTSSTVPSRTPVLRPPMHVPRGRFVSPLGRSMVQASMQGGPADGSSVVFISALAANMPGQALSSPLRQSQPAMQPLTGESVAWGGMEAGGVRLDYHRIPTIVSSLRPVPGNRPLSPTAHLPWDAQPNEQPLYALDEAGMQLQGGPQVDPMVFPAPDPSQLQQFHDSFLTAGSDQPLLGSVWLGSTGARTGSTMIRTAMDPAPDEGADVVPPGLARPGGREGAGGGLRTPLALGLRPLGVGLMLPRAPARVQALVAAEVAASGKGWQGTSPMPQEEQPDPVGWHLQQDLLRMLPGDGSWAAGAGVHSMRHEFPMPVWDPNGDIRHAVEGYKQAGDDMAELDRSWRGARDGVMSSMAGPISGPSAPPTRPAQLPSTSYRPHRLLRAAHFDPPPYPQLRRPDAPPLLGVEPPYQHAPHAAATHTASGIPYQSSALEGQDDDDDDSSIASTITDNSLREIRPSLARELRRRDIAELAGADSGVRGVTVRTLQREVTAGPHVKLLKPKQLLRNIQPPGPARSKVFTRRAELPPAEDTHAQDQHGVVADMERPPAEAGPADRSTTAEFPGGTEATHSQRQAATEAGGTQDHSQRRPGFFLSRDTAHGEHDPMTLSDTRAPTLLRIENTGVGGVRTLAPPPLPAGSGSPPRLLRLAQGPAHHQATRRHVDPGLGVAANEEPRYRNIRLMRVAEPGAQQPHTAPAQPQRPPGGLPMSKLRVLARPEGEVPGVVPAGTAGRTAHLLGMLRRPGETRAGVPADRTGLFSQAPHTTAPPTAFDRADAAAQSPPASPGTDVHSNMTATQPPAAPPSLRPPPPAPPESQPLLPHETHHHHYYAAPLAAEGAPAPGALADLTALRQLSNLTSLAGLGAAPAMPQPDDPAMWPDLMETTPDTLRQTGENTTARWRQQRAALGQPNMGPMRDMDPALELEPLDMLGPGPLGEAVYATRPTGPRGEVDTTWGPLATAAGSTVPRGAGTAQGGARGAGHSNSPGRWLLSRSPDGKVLAVSNTVGSDTGHRQQHPHQPPQHQLRKHSKGEQDVLEAESSLSRDEQRRRRRAAAEEAQLHGRAADRATEVAEERLAKDKMQSKQRSRMSRHRRRTSYTSDSESASEQDRRSASSQRSDATDSGSSTSSGRGRRHGGKHRRSHRRGGRDASKRDGRRAQRQRGESGGLLPREDVSVLVQAGRSVQAAPSEQAGGPPAANAPETAVAARGPLPAASARSTQTEPPSSAPAAELAPAQLPRLEPGDSFGMDLAEKLLRQMAEPAGLPRPGAPSDNWHSAPAGEPSVESAPGILKAEGAECVEPDSPSLAACHSAWPRAAAQGSGGGSPNAKMVDVLHGPETERRAQEILERQASIRTEFLAAAENLKAAAGKAKDGPVVDAAAGAATVSGPQKTGSLAAELTFSHATPPSADGSPSAFIQQQAALGPQLIAGSAHPTGPGGQAQTATTPSPAVAAFETQMPTLAQSQPIQIYCTQLVLNPGQGPITIPGMPAYYPAPGPAAWAGVPAAVPSSPQLSRAGMAARGANGGQAAVTGGPAAQLDSAPGDQAVYVRPGRFPGHAAPPVVRVTPVGTAAWLDPGQRQDGAHGGGGPGHGADNVTVPAAPGLHATDGPGPRGGQSSVPHSVMSSREASSPDGEKSDVGALVQSSGGMLSARRDDAGANTSKAAEEQAASEASEEVQTHHASQGSATEEDSNGLGSHPRAEDAAAKVNEAPAAAAKGNGAAAAAPRVQMAAELTQLILQAFESSGGVIQPAEDGNGALAVAYAVPAFGAPMSTTGTAGRAGHHSSLRPRDRQPLGVPKTAAAGGVEGAATAVQGATLLRLPATLPNAAVPRGTGPRFLQVQDIDLSHPTEADATDPASDPIAASIFAGLADWEAQAMAALQGRPPAPPARSAPGYSHGRSLTASEALALELSGQGQGLQQEQLHQAQQVAALRQLKAQREAALEERRARYQAGLERFADASQPLRPLHLPPPVHQVPPADEFLPLPPGGMADGESSHRSGPPRRRLWGGAAAATVVRGSGSGTFGADADAHGAMFGAGPPQYLTGPGVERQPHPRSPLQRRMHGEADPAKRRSGHPTMSPEAAALFAHQREFTRQVRSAVRSPGRAAGSTRRTGGVSWADGLRGSQASGGPADMDTGPSGGTTGVRVPYMARVSPQAGAVRSVAAMIAQRFERGGGAGWDTRALRDVAQGARGRQRNDDGPGFDGGEYGAAWQEEGPEEEDQEAADAECGGCTFAGCPARRTGDEEAEDPKTAAHEETGGGNMRAQREAARADLLDRWADEMRDLGSATARAQATKQVAVASAQQALSARRERRAAQLSDLFGLLAEVEAAAADMDTQAADTKRMMQALEEDAELRRTARLNALLFEAQGLGGQVDTALAEGGGVEGPDAQGAVASPH